MKTPGNITRYFDIVLEKTGQIIGQRFPGVDECEAVDSFSRFLGYKDFDEFCEMNPLISLTLIPGSEGYDCEDKGL